MKTDPKGKLSAANAPAAATVEAYLDAVPEEARGALTKLRTSIRAAAPDATELISYQIPTFKHRGRPLVAYAAWANHCGFYVMSTDVLDRHSAELERYSLSKATVRIRYDRPLPATLVKKLVKARITEIEQQEAAKKARKGVRS